MSCKLAQPGRSLWRHGNQVSSGHVAACRPAWGTLRCETHRSVCSSSARCRRGASRSGRPPSPPPPASAGWAMPTAARCREEALLPVTEAFAPGCSTVSGRCEEPSAARWRRRLRQRRWRWRRRNPCRAQTRQACGNLCQAPAKPLHPPIEATQGAKARAALAWAPLLLSAAASSLLTNQGLVDDCLIAVQSATALPALHLCMWPLFPSSAPRSGCTLDFVQVNLTPLQAIRGKQQPWRSLRAPTGPAC